jgi:hypothetical protein
VTHPLRFVFQRVWLLRDAGLSPQKTRGVPGKGNRDAEGTPHKPGQSRRYSQTVISVRGGEGSKGEKQVPRRARDDNGEGGAVLRGLGKKRPPPFATQGKQSAAATKCGALALLASRAEARPLHSDCGQRAGRRGRFAAGSKERTAVLAGLKPFPQGLKPLKAKHVMSELKLRPPKTQEPALTEARMERTQKQVPLWVRDDRGWRRSSMGG